MNKLIIILINSFLLMTIFSPLQFCSNSCEEIKRFENSVVPYISVIRRSKFVQQIKERDEKMADFKNLENGSNNLTIRFWFGNSSRNVSVLELKVKNCDWSGELSKLTYRFRFDGTDTSAKSNIDTLVEIKRVKSQVSPKDGWHYFIDSLFKLHLAKLPDYHNFENYSLPRDGSTTTLEIAVGKKYRVVTYPAPEFFKAEIGEADQILKIKKLLMEQFDLIEI